MITKNVRFVFVPTLRLIGDMAIQFVYCVAEVVNTLRNQHSVGETNADIQTKKEVKHDKL